MFTSTNAGKVIASATVEQAKTAFLGTLFLSTCAHFLDPGTAPSRLNANIIRDALVSADVPHKSCPTLAINRTTPAHLALSA